MPICHLLILGALSLQCSLDASVRWEVLQKLTFLVISLTIQWATTLGPIFTS